MADPLLASGATAPGAILVVDDDDLVRTLGIAALEQHGFAAMGAPDAAEAIRIVATCPYVELVVMDLSMPAMGGFECAQRLRRFRPDLPVIFTSGFEPGSPDEAFLPKPYRARELALAVRTRLERRQSAGQTVRPGPRMDPDPHGEMDRVRAHP